MADGVGHEVYDGSSRDDSTTMAATTTTNSGASDAPDLPNWILQAARDANRWNEGRDAEAMQAVAQLAARAASSRAREGDSHRREEDIGSSKDTRSGLAVKRGSNHAATSQADSERHRKFARVENEGDDEEHHSVASSGREGQAVARWAQDFSSGGAGHSNTHRRDEWQRENSQAQGSQGASSSGAGPSQSPEAGNDQSTSPPKGGNSRVLSQTKRAAQNRAAQRAFRERRDRYVKDLELKSGQIDAAIAAAQEAQKRYGEAVLVIEELRRENERLRKALGTAASEEANTSATATAMATQDEVGGQMRASNATTLGRALIAYVTGEEEELRRELEGGQAGSAAAAAAAAVGAAAAAAARGEGTRQGSAEAKDSDGAEDGEAPQGLSAMAAAAAAAAAAHAKAEAEENARRRAQEA